MTRVRKIAVPNEDPETIRNKLKEHGFLAEKFNITRRIPEIHQALGCSETCMAEGIFMHHLCESGCDCVIVEIVGIKSYKIKKGEDIIFFREEEKQNFEVAIYPIPLYPKKT